ncbi:hypothetical protein AB3N02_32335 [Priestia aryabhattai]|uniref:hypothetical protein n=1 Tax=Priestia aryabhattai TaxID=412384 RepID=UPI0039A16912
MEKDQTLKNAMDEWARVTQDPEVLMTYKVHEESPLDKKSTLKKTEKQGEKRGIMGVALSMIQKGMDNKTISELTDLTAEELEQIRKH